MILRGIGYFIQENEPFTSPKNGKTYFSCEVQSEDKKDTYKMSLPEPIVRDIKEAHYPKVEFIVNQTIRNGKNGLFVINDLVEIKRCK